MAKRKSLSKRSRFEVFKRDSFKCQYCGNSPPNVVLVVDHIVPVSAGGTNDIENLLTACNDCNAGKSDRPLGAVPRTMLMEVDELKERRTQMKAFNAWQAEKREIEDVSLAYLGYHWFNQLTAADEQNCYRFHPRLEASLKTFKRLGMSDDQICDAMDLALSRIRATFKDNDAAFKYFCGICWRTIKEDGRHEA